MKLSEQQITAIKHYEGPCLVLAVPGAGKTTILIQRILYLLNEKNIPPSSILALTFTKASADDMRKRILKLCKFNSVSNIRTLHSLCYEIIKYNAKLTHEKFDMFENDKYRSSRFEVIEEIFRQFENKPLDMENYNDILSAISSVKALEIKSITPSVEAELNVKHLKEYAEHYESYKKANNLLDFDDLLTNAAEILKHNKTVLDCYRSKFKFILLDEAQDTSNIQWQVIRLLLNDKNNIFAVADDDQSIYKFRGATPEKLLTFSQTFPNAKIIYMETNYRSVYEIVSSANKLIKNNKYRYNKKIESDKAKASTVKVSILKTREAQYNKITDLIPTLSGSTAIIYRNNLSAVGMMEALDRQFLKFNLKEHNTDFFRQSIIKDTVDILRFIDYCTDITSYEKVYYKLKGYISKNEIERVKLIHNGESVFKTIIHADFIPTYKKEQIASLQSACNKIKNNFKSNALDRLLYECGYLDYLEHFKRKHSRGIEGYLRYYRILDYISCECDSTESFIKRLEYLYKLAQKENNSSLYLTSMHSSKGLEFDNVILIDLLDDEIPGHNTSSTALEEERRLLYVGMTRAKEKLYMYSYKKDRDKDVKVSRFLNELK